MELSAYAVGPADRADLHVARSGVEDLSSVGAGASFAGAGPEAAGGETVVVHVQLRPRRSTTRRCLAALTALAARHAGVPFALTGLGGDDRIVRVTVGVELGPRELIAKFSDQAQAAYAFVDALFTDLYDYMPVYAAEPSEVERAAATGVLQAAAAPHLCTPVPRRSAPRIPSPRLPSELGGELPGAPCRTVAVPA